MTYNRNSDPSQFKLYSDGSLVAHSILTDAITVNSNDFTIGQYFSGRIDEAIVYSRALTADEVSSIYSNYLTQINGHFLLRKFSSYDPIFTLGSQESNPLLTTVHSIFIQPGTGNVGIKTNSLSSYSLTVNGSAFKTDGNSSWSYSSDIRLKERLEDFKYGLNEILQIKPISYYFKPGNELNIDPNVKHFGTTAQDLSKIIPEAVGIGDKGFLTVNNDAIFWAMLKAIQELKAENDSLKNAFDTKIKELEMKIIDKK